MNERRKKAGFALSVEDNAQRLHIQYQVLTLEQVQRLPGYQPPARYPPARRRVPRQQEMMSRSARGQGTPLARSASG